MSTANLNAVRFTKGRLFADPSSIAVSGTELGATRGRLYKPGHEQVQRTQEAFGGVVSEVWHMQKSPLFMCFLRDWDADAISKFFPDRSGAVVRANANLSGGVRSGYTLSSNSFKLLFLADDPTHMSIIVYKFLPFVDPEATIGLSLKEEFGVLVGGYGIPDATGRLSAIGLASSLSV